MLTAVSLNTFGSHLRLYQETHGLSPYLWSMPIRINLNFLLSASITHSIRRPGQALSMLYVLSQFLLFYTTSKTPRSVLTLRLRLLDKLDYDVEMIQSRQTRCLVS